MTRVSVVAAALLVLCALALVDSQNRARRLFVDIERAQNEARQLEIQWDQLQVEQTELTKASLIDGKARRTLSMQPVTPDRTLYLTLPAADAAASPDKNSKGGR